MRNKRRNNLLVESPSSATGDIAFNLIVFFLVCASVQPDSGREQTIPKSETVPEEQEQTENLRVDITRNAVLVNSDAVEVERLGSLLESRLAGKPNPDDRVVVVSSKPDVPYDHWINVTTIIDDAGGIITLQLEEEREVQLPE